MKTTLSIIAPTLCLLSLSACGSSEVSHDATGFFEATEVVVSAEQTGRIQAFPVQQGDIVDMGQQVVLIDTTQLSLRMAQLQAQRRAILAQRPDVASQTAALRQQLAKAQEEQKRFADLVAQGAAGSKQADDANAQVTLVQRQLDAQTVTLNQAVRAANAQAQALEAEMDILRDQMARCVVLAPSAGTLTERYAEVGELAVAARPLFKLIDMRSLYVRVYVTSAQLSRIAVGQKASVSVDFGGEHTETYGGHVSWVASSAEFTPKSIVTADERADMVYAVKVALDTDSSASEPILAKVGMYAHVTFL